MGTEGERLNIPGFRAGQGREGEFAGLKWEGSLSRPQECGESSQHCNNPSQKD